MEDELDIDPRPPSEVAARCIILAALVRRLLIENLAEATSTQELEAEAFDIRGWLQMEGIWEQLTRHERDSLNGSVGQLEDDQIATMAWQTEGLASIGWCLDLIHQLPLGESGPVAELMQIVPGPWQPTSRWIHQARLRTEAEIARRRERAEIEEWRFGIEPERRAGTEQQSVDLVALIAKVVQEAKDAGMTDGFTDGEFLVGEVPVPDIDEPDLDRLTILARERLRALNWVCGFGVSWDRVPLEV